MKAPQDPHLDERRTEEFAAELRERAQAWIPAWGLADGERDFGRALLEIAARFSSEVAERLDRTGDKMRRGFLDWLGIPRQAARPARLPVVFKLVDAANEAVLASAPVQMQADAAGTPVVFETEKDVRVVPGRLAAVVGVDAEADAYYLPPPGLNDLRPAQPLPTQWRLKSFVAAGATKLQLDPELGLAEEMILGANGQQYKIDKVDKDLVTIEPPLRTELAESTLLSKVTTFSPFGGNASNGEAHNWQEHALYLGDDDLLNIEAAATIEVVGASELREGYTWEYSGKRNANDEVDWLSLDFDDNLQQTVNDALVLTKAKGAAIEQKKVNGQNSRWIRAYSKTVDRASSPFSSDKLSLRVNASGCSGTLPCPPAAATDSPVPEAMANTTPLVLNKFFPFGKEPRQFDAFYLGSKESFSKKDAQVQLCFEMSESSFAALSSLRAGSPAQTDRILAGVGADGYLHLLQFDPVTGVLTRYPNREPLRPPSPDSSGATVSGPTIALDPTPGFRAPIWVDGTKVCIAVTAGNMVWYWREDTIPPSAQSGWVSAGSVGPADPNKPIDGLVFLDDGAHGRLFALRDSKLFVREIEVANPVWELVDWHEGALKKIVPIMVQSGANGEIGTGTLTEGMVGVMVDVDDPKKLHCIGITFSGSPLQAQVKPLLDNVASDLTPAAVRRTDHRLVVVAADKEQPNTDRRLLAFRSKAGNFEPATHNSIIDASLYSRYIVGHSIDVNQNGGHLTFVTCTQIPGESTSLAAWVPFDTASPPQAVPKVVLSALIPTHLGMPNGAPTLLSKHVIVPTTSSHVLVELFDASLWRTREVTLQTAVIASAPADLLQPSDQVFLPYDDSGLTKYQRTAFAESVLLRGQTLYRFDLESKNEPNKPFLVVRANATTFTAVDLLAPEKLKIDPGDSETKAGSYLLITTDASTELYYVRDFDSGTRIATLDRQLNITNPTQPIHYRLAKGTGAELRPLLKLDPATGDWDAALLDRTRLVFPGATPMFQHGIAYQVDASNNHPVLVALSKHWTFPPPHVGTSTNVQFFVDAAGADWSVQLGDTLTNPELSWEYWNGKGWWGLGVTDNTQHLKATGLVIFSVPSDIASSDWAGKTNFWIRARLVGGDYGREKVSVKISGSEQTVERSTVGIRAPQVLNLHISYAVCKEVPPTYVLAQDSGSFRDQSDANRTAEAIVEAFVPLALTLGRLSHPAAPLKAPGDCPPECDDLSRQTAAVQPPATAVAVPASVPASGRALFIGLDATPSEAPVNVLLLLEERGHTAFAPMTIETLVADHFEPIVADDATRALGESGVLSMAFAVPPTPSDLFGQKGLTWLRLTPKANANGEWAPALRGAYLNAVWASATETLTRELLGSSDGAPNMSVLLARPPVLDHTLELRVKEPLGDEERAALRKADKDSVSYEVDGLPGDWVLWKQVVDPNDEPADARVYALDEASGEIRFGDGWHGRIPPIGRDVIVAFRYQRTEPGPSGSSTVPGNLITARTALNLVSPVATVESVTAADQAAGGAPPEDDNRVLRFGYSRLRHRDRAVTLHDLEDLAVQSSPDIVQARAVARRDSIRLVVVMKGRIPVPMAAQVRALSRLLLASAPVSLSAPDALQIKGPEVRRLRIRLQLRVETLGHAGALGRYVKERLAVFFDTATGGIDHDGWALGLSPSPDDIAFVLIDAPHLDSIEDVTLYEIALDGSERPWLDTLQPTELAMLHDDGLRIQFETAEVEK